MRISGTWGAVAAVLGAYAGSSEALNLSMTHYYQSTGYYCGPATGKMVIKHVSGRVYSQYTLARYMGVSWAGTGPYQVASAIRHYSGFNYRVVGLYTVNLRNLTIYHINRNRPVPANFNGRYLAYWRYHYVPHHSVLKGYTSGGYYVHDTWKGPNRWASNTQMYNAIRYNNNVYTRLY